MKKWLSLLLAVIMVLSSLAVLGSCSGDKKDKTEAADGSADKGSDSKKGDYTVTVVTKGGMCLPGLKVYVYEDDTLKNPVDFGETDENGSISFKNLAKKDDYAVVVSGAPEGYKVADSYKFTGNSAKIVLKSSLIEGDGLSSASLGLGSVMHDFSVTTTDGSTFTLSEALKEKDMVLINFWYTTCSWCVKEFPYMEQAYQQYKDDIEIIALDPMATDTINSIVAFKEEQRLSFPMAQCSPSWANAFGISGYPTSIIVDRYGVICMIEAGGIVSLRPFICAFDHFTGDDYKQKLCEGGVGDLVTQVKPTYTMESSEEISKVINKGDIKVTYRPETEDANAEYCWPFMITERKGEKCIYASNKEIDGSFAIIYADVELKKGQAIGFDYLVSTEKFNDVLYVIVNDEDIYQIYGNEENPQWKSCYPCVATEDGTYELALCYLKDDSTNEGEDTVYIKNMRVVDSAKIDAPTYLPREAAVSVDDGYEYAEIFFNEQDGYYHVGSKTGPLLLANLMGATQFNDEETFYDFAYNGELVRGDKDYSEKGIDYCSYASNSSLQGYCTVNKELYELLCLTDEIKGFDDDDDKEWLKMCKYYQAYGTSGEQLEDPIKGLARFSAYTATLGKNVPTNVFTYNRAIIPRGLLAKFVPDKSGAYRITSHATSPEGVDGWIFGESDILYTYEHDERMYADEDNVSMVYYMEAGKAYYIDIAFWDVYENGTIPYDIEYLGASYKLFRLASPGYFTYDADATGETMYYTISGGIDVVLNSDGKYYEDLGKDANGNQKYGSLIYADFSGITPIFDAPLTSIIERGAFDFTKTEDDLYILTYMKQNDNDPEKTKEALKEIWGEDYDSYADHYKLDDVLAGRYHGTGTDLTAEIKTYIAQMDKSGTEADGCVVVTKRLAELLQLLMDKYTFKNVDNSWCKVCYYYDYIGA